MDRDLNGFKTNDTKHFIAFCSLNPRAAPGLILLSASFTGEDTEAWGHEVTNQGPQARK